MDSVQTSANVRKPEVADEPVPHPVPDDGAQRTLRRYFDSVAKFETSQAQAAWLVSSNAFEAHEPLFQENTKSVIRIRRKVRTAEAELPLWRRCDSPLRQTDQCGLSQFEKPILRLELPADRHTKQRRAIAVGGVSGSGLKKIPILESESHAARKCPPRN